MILGITGPIGSGKSTVAEALGRLGVPVYDSDRRAKELMTSELRPQLIELLGAEAFEGVELNRRWVAERMFGDAELKKEVEAVVHPAVVRDFGRWAASTPAPVGWVAVESALLFESGLDRAVDAVLVVEAPEELRIERTMRRDNVPREAVVARIAHQMPPDQWARHATWTIQADGRPLDEEAMRLFEEKLIPLQLNSNL